MNIILIVNLAPPPLSNPSEAARAAEERARALEADHAVENLALENLLKELSQQAQMALDVAVDAQQRAASAVVGELLSWHGGPTDRRRAGSGPGMGMGRPGAALCLSIAMDVMRMTDDTVGLGIHVIFYQYL